MINPIAFNIVQHHINRLDSIYIGTFDSNDLIDKMHRFFDIGVTNGIIHPSEFTLHWDSVPIRLINYRKVHRNFDTLVNTIKNEINSLKLFFVYSGATPAVNLKLESLPEDLLSWHDKSIASTIYKMYKQNWHCFWDHTPSANLTKKITI